LHKQDGKVKLEFIRYVMKPQQLHIQTPLIESKALSIGITGTVWLKMEALQPTGSFKLRGIGRACLTRIAKGATTLVSSSGGNAGIAVAYCGRRLGVPVTVVVPESTPQTAIARIRLENAQVVIKGRTWMEAHQYSLGMAGSGCAYIHPFDDPLLWEGHSTIIDETLQAGLVPDIVVLSVGGGGLLCGIIQGLRASGLDEVPVLAVETRGAHSLMASIQAGELVELADITSIATSLGAKKVADQAFQWTRRHPVIGHCVSDRQAVDACVAFADQHHLLVEPACGASLSVQLHPPACLADKENIMVVVCGGAGVNLEQLCRWKQKRIQTEKGMP
jgi:L-serine/L-threonine ammonia-lyase